MLLTESANFQMHGILAQKEPEDVKLVIFHTASFIKRNFGRRGSKPSSKTGLLERSGIVNSPDISLSPLLAFPVDKV